MRRIVPSRGARICAPPYTAPMSNARVRPAPARRRAPSPGDAARLDGQLAAGASCARLAEATLPQADGAPTAECDWAARGERRAGAGGEPAGLAAPAAPRPRLRSMPALPAADARCRWTSTRSFRFVRRRGRGRSARRRQRRRRAGADAARSTCASWSRTSCCWPCRWCRGTSSARQPLPCAGRATTAAERDAATRSPRWRR